MFRCLGESRGYINYLVSINSIVYVVQSFHVEGWLDVERDSIYGWMDITFPWDADVLQPDTVSPTHPISRENMFKWQLETIPVYITFFTLSTLHHSRIYHATALSPLLSDAQTDKDHYMSRCERHWTVTDERRGWQRSRLVGILLITGQHSWWSQTVRMRCQLPIFPLVLQFWEW